MTKVTRQRVVDAALDLLDDVGLDGVSTRQLAQRLGVEQPSLYWHFKRKDDLLAAMAEDAMTPLREAELPSRGDDWRDWFAENYRQFRRALLLHRDGARLHAGTFPRGDDLDRLLHKIGFLADAGFPEEDARTAMLAASRFTLGSALEEQADPAVRMSGSAEVDAHARAFEAGLHLIVSGLAGHQAHDSQVAPTTSASSLA